MLKCIYPDKYKQKELVNEGEKNHEEEF